MSSVSEYLRDLPPAQQKALKEHVTAAVLAVDLCRRCVESPGARPETVAEFGQYVRQAMHALEAVQTFLPDDAPERSG